MCIRSNGCRFSSATADAAAEFAIEQHTHTLLSRTHQQQRYRKFLSIRELVIINLVWANRYVNTEYIYRERAQHFMLHELFTCLAQVTLVSVLTFFDSHTTQVLYTFVRLYFASSLSRPYPPVLRLCTCFSFIYRLLSAAS